MEFDQKEETPFTSPKKKEMEKKTLAIYAVTGIICVSSLIYGYSSYQASYFKDTQINKLKSDLEEASIKLQRIDMLENQVKNLEASLATKVAPKPFPKKEAKPAVKKGDTKILFEKKPAKVAKTPAGKAKNKKPLKK